MVVAHACEVGVAVLEECLLGFDFLEADDVGVDGVDGHCGGDEFVLWFGVIGVVVSACEGWVVVGVEEVFDVVDGETEGAFLGCWCGFGAELLHEASCLFVFFDDSLICVWFCGCWL